MHNKNINNTKLQKDVDYQFENMLNLRICRTCFELFGTIYLEDRQLVWQRCTCNYISEDNWLVGKGKYKMGYDYNRLYETCYCCGLRVIHCGSRWSSFYCSYCREKIINLNKVAGQCIVPIGRHSIMNGIFMDRSAITHQNDQAIDSFVQSINRTTNLIELTYENKKKILERQIALTGLAEDGYVADFIELVNDLNDINKLRDEAFYDLLAHLTGKSIDELKALLVNHAVYTVNR